MERTRDAAHGVVRFYDVTTGTECGEALTGQKDEVTAAAFTPDGRTLATGHPDGLVRLWDLSTRQEKADFRPRDGRVLALTFTADGRAVAALMQALDAPALLHVWRAATEEDVRAYAERNRP
jgi:WD40 repeat protein